MTKFVFSPPEIPSLPVLGTDARFPVRRIWCVGRNYLAHAREMGGDTREPPFFFAKHPDMIVPDERDGATVPYSSLTANLHHEVELVLALGSGGVDISEDKALACMFGYAVGIDLTRRDLQNVAREKGHPWEIAKSFENSAPVAAIVPASAGPVAKGRIALSVNGAPRQDSDISFLIWQVPEIIARLSRQVALAAGDIIFTGTPEGVGPVVRGDRIDASIAGLPPLRVTIA